MSSPAKEKPATIFVGQNQTARRIAGEESLLTTDLQSCCAVILSDATGLASLTHVDNCTDPSFIMDELSHFTTGPVTLSIAANDRSKASGAASMIMTYCRSTPKLLEAGLKSVTFCKIDKPNILLSDSGISSHDNSAIAEINPISHSNSELRVMQHQLHTYIKPQISRKPEVIFADGALIDRFTPDAEINSTLGRWYRESDGSDKSLTAKVVEHANTLWENIYSRHHGYNKRQLITEYESKLVSLLKKYEAHFVGEEAAQASVSTRRAESSIEVAGSVAATSSEKVEKSKLFRDDL